MNTFVFAVIGFAALANAGLIPSFGYASALPGPRYAATPVILPAPVPAPVYIAPLPAPAPVYPPAPVYAPAPAPVYPPAPVYAPAPAPVYAAPAPAPVYAAPAPVYATRPVVAPTPLVSLPSNPRATANAATASNGLKPGLYSNLAVPSYKIVSRVLLPRIGGIGPVLPPLPVAPAYPALPALPLAPAYPALPAY